MDLDLAALIAALAAFFGSPVAIMVTARQRRRDKLEDWRRQDELALRTTASDKVIAEAVRQQHIAARLAAANAAQSRDALAQIQAMSQTTHQVVTSEMTRAMQSELAAHLALVTVLLRDVAETEAAGRPAPAEMIATLRASEAAITVLAPKIIERLSATASDVKGGPDAGFGSGSGPPDPGGGPDAAR